jgi:glycosyltransferase involved in cell wall biosynthesis
MTTPGELETRLAEEVRRRRAAESKIGALTRRLAEQEAETARVRRELDTIHRSRLWRIGHAYWSLLRRLRPDAGNTGAALLSERIRVGGRGVVVFLPSIGWAIDLVQRPHHLARAFAALGYVSIFDCEGSYDPVAGFQEVEPNLFLFRGERSALHQLPSPILWCFPYNYHLAGGFPENSVTVYDWIDDLSVFPYDRDLLEQNHRRALNEATVVASVARGLDARARAVRTDALYLPNGVDYERFAGDDATVPDDPELARVLAAGRPVAGYYGAFAEWFDYDLVDEVALRKPDWSFVLIGPMLDDSLKGKPLLERRNVFWAGPRNYSRLSGYLRCFDVAMIPFRINDITLATSPLKLYEYMAGGKPIVTTPMPECAAFPEVRIARDAEEFSCALDAALEEGKDERFRSRLRQIGRENSWPARVEAVLSRIEERRGERPLLHPGERSVGSASAD